MQGISPGTRAADKLLGLVGAQLIELLHADAHQITLPDSRDDGFFHLIERSVGRVTGQAHASDLILALDLAGVEHHVVGGLDLFHALCAQSAADQQLQSAAVQTHSALHQSVLLNDGDDLVHMGLQVIDIGTPLQSRRRRPQLILHPGHLLAQGGRGEAGGQKRMGIAINRQHHELCLTVPAGNRGIAAADVADGIGVPGDEHVNAELLHGLFHATQAIGTHTVPVDAAQAIHRHSSVCTTIHYIILLISLNKPIILHLWPLRPKQCTCILSLSWKLWKRE